MHFDILLMTSRSGSSMVADIVVKHGFHWATSSRNPVVGGKKVRYKSFENQVVKEHFRKAFGMPLGDMITYDDQHVEQFGRLLNKEYRPDKPNVWKGAVEFWPIWQAAIAFGWIETFNVGIIYRDFEAVIESVLAKRQGRGDEGVARRITQKRYDIMHSLAAEYAFPLIMTDELIAGNYSTIEQHFDHGQRWHGVEFDRKIADRIINPEKWETDR